MSLCGSLWVILSPYLSLKILKALIGLLAPYWSLWILMGPNVCL